MWKEYEATEKIAIDYKNRVPGSSDKLVESFKEFINKYIEVICNGKNLMNTRSIRNFISLFMKNKIYARNIKMFRRAPSVRTHSFVTVDYIKDLFSIYEKGDIENILVLSLLELADNYTPIDDKPRFHSYVMKCYHFKVYHSLISVTKDPLYNCSEFNDNEFMSYDIIDHNILEVKHSFLITESDIVVDDNWVAGFTSDIFSEYSSVDRVVLKMKYIDGKTDSEIGEELGSCRVTVNRRRSRVEKHLKQRLKSLNILKE